MQLDTIGGHTRLAVQKVKEQDARHLNRDIDRWQRTHGQHLVVYKGRDRNRGRSSNEKKKKKNHPTQNSRNIDIDDRVL